MARADTLIHEWNFARATSQDEALDACGVAVAIEMPRPEDEQIRMPGAFGGKIDAAAGVDPRTRLLNVLGRTV